MLLNPSLVCTSLTFMSLPPEVEVIEIVDDVKLTPNSQKRKASSPPPREPPPKRMAIARVSKQMEAYRRVKSKFTAAQVAAIHSRMPLDVNASRVTAQTSRIYLDTSIDPDTGKKKHFYYIDGKRLAGWISGSKIADLFFKPFDREAEAAMCARRKVGRLEAFSLTQYPLLAIEAKLEEMIRYTEALKSYAETARSAIRATMDAKGKFTEEGGLPLILQSLDIYNTSRDEGAKIFARCTTKKELDDIDFAKARWEEEQEKSAEGYKQDWEDAAEFGTYIHATAENFFTRKEHWKAGDERPPDGLLKFLQDNPTYVVWGCELLIFDDEFKITGSVDLILLDTATGKFYLVDLKATKGSLTKEPEKKDWSKRPPDAPKEKEMGTHPLTASTPASKKNKYGIQVNAYTYIVEKVFGIVISGIILLHLPSPRCAKYNKISIDKLENIREFLAASMELRNQIE